MLGATAPKHGCDARKQFQRLPNFNLANNPESAKKHIAQFRIILQQPPVGFEIESNI
jgi:hypothetical protein